MDVLDFIWQPDARWARAGGPPCQAGATGWAGPGAACRQAEGPTVGSARTTSDPQPPRDFLHPRPPQLGGHGPTGNLRLGPSLTRPSPGRDPPEPWRPWRYLHGPDGLVQRVEELEAEAVLLGGPLDELAAVQQDGAHPLAHLGRLVNEQHTRLQHAPQFGPALQRAPNLRGGAAVGDAPAACGGAGGAGSPLALARSS